MLRDYEHQLGKLFDRKSEEVTYAQLMSMAKHRRYSSSDAMMRTTATPIELAVGIASASRDVLGKLKELEGAAAVEIASVGELKRRVPALASDSSDTEVEGFSIAREQAREHVGTSAVKRQQESARAFLVTHAGGAVVYRAGS